MATDVGSLLRMLKGCNKDRTVVNDSSPPKSTALITMDLLGGGGDHSQDVDLDLKVPSGWEKRLDLKTGKVFLERQNSNKQQNSSSQTTLKFEELNFRSNTKPLLNLFDDNSLDLKLNPMPMSMSMSTPVQNNIYQSVCTLDKVKSALERAEKEPSIKKRYSSSYSSSTSETEDTEDKFVDSSPVATGCPSCLSYVLIMKNNPKCPRCNSFVPMVTTTATTKKLKIDLNF